jgi:hypothetical protein
MGFLARVRSALSGRRSDVLETWRELARRQGLWPVTNSFESVYAVTRDGQVVASNYDDFRERIPIEDLRERNWLLHEAATRYPELAHLEPRRGPRDPDCTDCRGTGRHPDVPKGSNIVCYCGGLGWLPTGYVDPHRDPAV